MSESPALNDVFNPKFDEFSISRYDFVVPDHFDVFVPEYLNETDFQCLSVICPSPKKNAKRWTYNGRWLTIGVYRDEGRDPTVKPATTNLSWTRVGTKLTIIDPAGHKLHTGDPVNLYNINVPQLMNVPIVYISSTTFTVQTSNAGLNLGVDGAYQLAIPYNFFEQNYVFRILPSFVLVPWSLVQQLFADSAPIQAPQKRELFNVTYGVTAQVPKGLNKSTNYSLPITGQSIDDDFDVSRRFDQVYDENGTALKISYKQDGQPVSSRNYDFPHLDNHKAFNAPLINENAVYGDSYRVTTAAELRATDDGSIRLLNLPHDEATSDIRVYVFDFYGYEINDPRRGPYFSTELITRDLTKPAPYNNILRAGQNNVAYYSKKLYDIFNNYVIGIQETNATVIRQNLLPLELDRFNRPVKKPALK